LPDHYYRESRDYDSSFDYITSSDHYDNEAVNHYDEACDHDNEAGSHDNDAGDRGNDACDLVDGACGTRYSEAVDCMGECADNRGNTHSAGDTGWVFYLRCEKDKSLKEGRIGLL
jgi:hypothetical protein